MLEGIDTPGLVSGTAASSADVEHMNEDALLAELGIGDQPDSGDDMGALQQSINAAVADVANAKTPDEAKKAQQRLTALMEQMARLEQQLQEAKVRQINEAPVRKLKI